LSQVENQVHEITLRRPSTILKAQPIQDLKYENPFRKEEEASEQQKRKMFDKQVSPKRRSRQDRKHKNFDEKALDSTTKLFNYEKSLFDKDLTSSSHASHLETPQVLSNYIPNLKEVNQQIQTNYQSQKKLENPEKI